MAIDLLSSDVSLQMEKFPPSDRAHILPRDKEGPHLQNEYSIATIQRRQKTKGTNMKHMLGQHASNGEKMRPYGFSMMIHIIQQEENILLMIKFQRFVTVATDSSGWTSWKPHDGNGPQKISVC